MSTHLHPPPSYLVISSNKNEMYTYSPAEPIAGAANIEKASSKAENRTDKKRLCVQPGSFSGCVGLDLQP